MDISEQCGTSLDDQHNLWMKSKLLLPDIDMIVVVSKADLMEPRPENWDEVCKQNRSGMVRENLTFLCFWMKRAV